MSNKEQLQNNNAQLATLIQTLQGKAIGGGGGGGGAPADWAAAEGQPGHVLNRTHYSFSEEKTVYSEITGTSKNGMIDVFDPYEYYPKDGEICTVMWNGVEYTCAAFADEMMGMKYINIGNKLGTSLMEDTGEPFAIMLYSEEMAAILQGFCSVIAYGNTTSVTASVKAQSESTRKLDDKYIHPRDWNAGAGENGHILNRTHYTEKKWLMAKTPFYNVSSYAYAIWLEMPVIGETYCVNWNEEPYNCVCRDGEEGLVSMGGVDDATGVICPFVMTIMASDGMVFGMIVAVDGSTDFTVSVSQEGFVHPLDEKYIPAMSKLTLLSPNGTKYHVTVDDSGALTATAAT